MVYFKLEFGFHLPGRKHRAENKTNTKAQPAWEFISKEVESAEARKCYKTAANYRTAANSLTGIVHEHHFMLHAFLAYLI